MNADQVGELIGDFAWSFSDQFFIETNDGNFIWSDPDYNGTGIIKPTEWDYKRWLKSCHIPYGRDKGKHRIKDYCGEFKFVK